MSAFRTLDSADVKGKRVLLRVDLNVPIENGRVTDLTRIERVAPTILEIADKGGKVILMAHLGRPKGKPDPAFTLKPVAAAVADVIKRPVAFASDCIGEPAAKAVAAMKNGDVLCLENTRFYKAEEKNEPEFVAELAKSGDIYVNDAFSAAHRAHASTEGVAQYLPAFAGRLMQAELEALGAALDHPERPVMAIVGGSKVSTKLDLLNNLVTKVDILVIGGAMANTFLAAEGHNVGKSLQEADLHDTARAIMKTAAAHGCEILLPKDVVVAEKFEANAPTQVVGVDAIPANAMALDVGPASVAAFIARLPHIKTIIWNGPLGAFETKPFDTATNALALAIAEATREGKIVSVGGGGDTVSALKLAGAHEHLSYLSTAGGAFLEWMEGKVLPGVEALSKDLSNLG